MYGLDRDTSRKMATFLKLAHDEGADLRITSGKRTYKEQALLYLQGRTREGDVVTNALPGTSYHNIGRAFDVAFEGAEPYPDDPGVWEFLGQLGEAAGLRWGGSFGDDPHFENPTPKKLTASWPRIAFSVGPFLASELREASSMA